MYRVEHHVGRLIEVKLASPLTIEEVQHFVQDHLAIMKKIPGKYIGVVDLLEAYVFPPAVADAMIQLLSGAASHVERTAILIGESATFALQVERAIRSSNSENRRVFRLESELVAWLREVLTLHERARLDLFMHERPVRK
jgi:hypothetical protein